MKKTILVTIVIFAMLSGTSCQGRDDTSRTRLALMKTTNPEPLQTQYSYPDVPEEAVKKDVAKMPELYDVAVVKGKKDVLVAYKVRHMHRFRMKAIEKKVTQKLEKKYPDANFTVSSDYKIFLEATRLRDEVKRGKMSGKEAEDRLQQIIKLQQEKA